MATQNAVEVELAYGFETTWGVPATSLKRMHRVSSTLSYAEEAIESQRQRPDREVADLGRGTASSEGDISDEFAIGDHDEWIEALFCGTWADGPTWTGSADLDALDGTVTRSADSFIADGFRVGMVVSLAGATNTVSKARIAALTDTVMTLEDADLVDETVGALTVSAPGKVLKNGKVKRSLTLQQFYPDIDGDPYEVFPGQRIGTATLTVSPRGNVSIRYGVRGKASLLRSTSLDASIDALPTGEILSGVSGRAYLNGVPLTLLTDLSVEFNNELSGDGVAFSRELPHITYGRFMVSLNFTAFFDADTLLKAQRNATEMVLELRFESRDGTQFENLILPRVRFQRTPKNIQGNGPVTLSGQGMALRSEAYGCTVLLQRSNA